MDSTRSGHQLEAKAASGFQSGGIYVRCLPRAALVSQRGVVSPGGRRRVGEVDKPKLGKSHVSCAKAWHKQVEAHCGPQASESILSRLPYEVRDAETDAEHFQAGELHVLLRSGGRLLCPRDQSKRPRLLHGQCEGPTLAPRRFTDGLERLSVPVLHADAPDGALAALSRACGEQRFASSTPSSPPQSSRHSLARTESTTLRRRLPVCNVVSLGGSGGARHSGFTADAVWLATRRKGCGNLLK
jgi:hypothetical protein